MALTALDQVICNFDRALRISSGALNSSKRSSPAKNKCADLNREDRQTASRLMRVNHTGEVCAQALYQGQAITSRNQKTRALMQQSAEDEPAHLVWCAQRINELGSHTSYLNPKIDYHLNHNYFMCINKASHFNQNYFPFITKVFHMNPIYFLYINITSYEPRLFSVHNQSI